MYKLYFHCNGEGKASSRLDWQAREDFDRKQFAIDGPGGEKLTSVQVAVKKRVDWPTTRHITGPVPLYYKVRISLFFRICVVDGYRLPPTSEDTYGHDARTSVNLQKKAFHYKTWILQRGLRPLDSMQSR